MVKLPDEVFNAINAKSSKVLATVNAAGNPHVIQVGSIIAPSPEMIAFGAILMKKTSKNLESMRKENQEVAILVTVEMKSYLVMAKIKEHYSSGPLVDQMNEELKKMGLKANVVWTVEPSEVFNQSASYEAGSKMV